MEDYKAILKLINDKLEEDERIINFYRDEKAKADEYIAKLTDERIVLKEKLDGCKAEREELLHCIGLQEDEIKHLREEIAITEEKVAQYEIPKKVADV